MRIRVASIAAGVLLAGCGGGGGGGGGGASGGGGAVSPPPPPPPPPPVRIVYTADQDAVNQSELYLVDIARPGESTKLSGALVAGGNVANIAATPDGTRIIYRADQDTDGVSELYAVTPESAGESIKLNGSLVAGGTVFEFAVSPAGTHVAYRADQDTDDVSELYLVDLANPGTSAKLNSALVPGGDVFDTIRFSPDGTQVMYRADQDVDNLGELYVVDVDAPGVSTKLNDALVVGGIVAPFYASFSPDGTKVAYIADQDTNGVNELYLVDVATPGTSVKLNGGLVAGGNVEYFTFSPDGTQVAYQADQDTDDVLELYLVDVATPGVSIKLSDALVAGGNTSNDFVFSPDGARLIYSADQDTDEVRELYLVDTAAPGTSMKVNESFVAGGELSFIFAFSPDGAQIVYGAEQDTDDVRELYLVDSATPGASIKLSAPLIAGGNAGGFRFSPDGTQVVYFADQDTDGVGELYLVDTAAPGVSTKLNGEVAAGAEGAHNFLFLP